MREKTRALKSRGVSHAALFGSLARGEIRRWSDIDILVEIEPGFSPRFRSNNFVNSLQESRKFIF
ncbi:MAG TPA: nucleotidyltransferase domain-containing protein [Roseiarcus sp.]|nr:nucleotidyltransferase domain-containing protein [Roseiarcus sp.]